MKQLLLFVMLLVPCCMLIAQQKEVTGLLYELKTVTGYEQKADVLSKLAAIYQRINPDSAYLFATQLEALAIAHNDKQNQCKAQLAIARYYGATGRPKDGLLICEKVITQLQQEKAIPDFTGEFWQVKGNCLVQLNRKREALAAFYESLKIAEATNVIQGKISAIGNIGWVYMELYQFDNAIAEFNKARLLAENHTAEVPPYYIPKIYNNLASCYGEKGRSDSAFLYTNKSIDAALKINDYESAANGLNILASALMEEKKYTQALEKLLQAKTLRQKVGDPFFIVSDMATLASLYSAMGNNSESIHTAKAALSIAKEYKIDAKLPMIYQSLALGYERAGNYPEAANTYKILSNLKDTLFEKANTEAIAKMKVQYETEKKESENNLLKKDNDLKAALLINKTRTIYALFILALFIAALMFGWITNIRLRKNKSELKAISDLQKEKERIARDLHDNVGGQLSYIIYSLDGINEESKDRRVEITESVNRSVRSVIGNLRETIWAISDANIQLQDFSDKLKIYTRDLFKYTDTKLFFTENIPGEKELNALLGLNLYRVCQEILTNAFKYSEATEVKIILKLTDKKLVIRIDDNGKGFDVKQENEQGYGLQNIHKRTDEFGIGLTLETAAGKGTKYELVV